ncbi:DUF3012 domain-containing protein [Alteromonas sp. 5E99-2]|uniref:DUF3012 domain-containing protein n=1 Tax=Alteromonas sp. 5E99-2 TaxID=2817683 RepID=UPI001A98514E|nr:DUF3012 domain-containing protein [Alteromonas sp. 5E99-2]MBO1256719.1 DUF3012 domain-containing protein [Alteromonas sp. 5E99-2]
MKKALTAITLISSVILLSACSPKVGSEAWCKDLKEKSKGDWTANEAKDFASHCIFKSKD